MRDAIERPMLSAFCTDALWSKGTEVWRHKLCQSRGEGRFLAQHPLPGGTGPDIYGLCTCACHQTAVLFPHSAVRGEGLEPSS